MTTEVFFISSSVLGSSLVEVNLGCIAGRCSAANAQVQLRRAFLDDDGEGIQEAP